jgi:hypothetical protein
MPRVALDGKVFWLESALQEIEFDLAVRNFCSRSIELLPCIRYETM